MAATSLSTQLAFDYGEIPAAEQKALERHAENVLKIHRAMTKNTVALGAELAEAHKRLSNHGNGTFGKWCVERCGISNQHALRLINVHEVFGTKRFEQIVQNFEPSALYKLSADTCPEKAIEDCVKLARKGEVITHKRAKEIIGENTVDEGNSDTDESADDEQSPFDLESVLGPIVQSVVKLRCRAPKTLWPLIAGELKRLTEDFEI